MRKGIYAALFFLSVVLVLGLVSASLCKGYNGYYQDCYSYDSYGQSSRGYFHNGPYYAGSNYNAYDYYDYDTYGKSGYYDHSRRRPYDDDRYDDNDWKTRSYPRTVVIHNRPTSYSQPHRYQSSQYRPSSYYNSNVYDTPSLTRTYRTEYVSESSLYERTTDYAYGPYGLEGTKTTVVKKRDLAQTHPSSNRQYTWYYNTFW